MGYFGGGYGMGSPLLSLLGQGLQGAGQGIAGLGGDLHSWLSSLMGPSSGMSSFNPTAGTGLNFAPALGPGGTGSGTGSGVGPYLPNTPTPSLAELTGVPGTAGAPGAPYAYGGAPPASTGVPEAGPSPGAPSAYTPPGEPGGTTDWASLFHKYGAHNPATLAQGMAAGHAGMPADAMSAIAAALQRAAAYRQMILGS